MEILFWIFIALLLYSYLGYPLLIFLLSVIFKLFGIHKKKEENTFEPDVTLFVTAYNEIDYVNQKVKNSFNLDYPKNKLQYIWVTDGSTDGTNDALKKFSEIKVLHEKERKGKINAMNRGMKFVTTPIVIFSDANTILNKNCIKEILNEFNDVRTGCVAGEKRIIPLIKDDAVNTGESIYWQYESLLKKCESDVNSAIGAVGELFAIRTDLYSAIEDDTILDDFVISLRIAQLGYKIKYTSNAYAEERASTTIKEELKRKNRIAFGAFQTLFRLKELLNPLRHPFLTFQYISHKVFRWIFVPLVIPILFLLNILILLNHSNPIYVIFFLLQVMFYFLVILGYLLQSKKIKFKQLFAPFYIFVMNYSLIIGLIRYIRKSQSEHWERAKRG